MANPFELNPSSFSAGSCRAALWPLKTVLKEPLGLVSRGLVALAGRWAWMQGQTLPPGSWVRLRSFYVLRVGRVIPHRGGRPIKPAWPAALWRLSQAQRGLSPSPSAHLTPNAEAVAVSSSRSIRRYWRRSGKGRQPWRNCGARTATAEQNKKSKGPCSP